MPLLRLRHPGLNAPDDFGDDQDDDADDFDGGLYGDEPEESECALCEAPFHGSRRYCTQACEDADAPEPGTENTPDAEVEHHTVLSENPWTTTPRT
ncbi:hypothetical protein AB0O31_33005 [Kitasatospora cineracea]|uniref:hypothetical protein n=1 Tax=Kitasatospora cineracea TaxID=88074 RepID=UPI003428F3D3